MADNLTPVLLVTANVGSIFEDPEHMLKLWVYEFLKLVKCLQPKFLALHCQEVGGKNYEVSMQYVDEFVRVLMSSEELRSFDRVKVFLDEDFTSIDKFTALGNLYFIHESIKLVQIWDFVECRFVPVIGREAHSGNIENVNTKEKAKFPQDFFPECKWSRKGFLRTRWNLNGTIFDLINIHLFHDASNFIAAETSPSVYSGIRQRAFKYALERFENDKFSKVPYFVFGDFNFRLDTQEIIQRLTNKTKAVHLTSGSNKNKVVKVMYKDETNENNVILTLEKKVFDHHAKHEEIFTLNNGKWLLEMDKEVRPFLGDLFEHDIDFPPSYPFCEDINDGKSYMKTRCPSWCDRILCSKSARNIIYYEPSNESSVLYNMIGPDVCMGDHKPVFLHFRMLHNKGNLFIPHKCTPVSLEHLPSQHSPQSISSSNNYPYNSFAESNPLFRQDSAALSSPPAHSPHRTSKPKLKGQLSRTLSHHSSSSEEWYEDLLSKDKVAHKHKCILPPEPSRTKHVHTINVELEKLAQFISKDLNHGAATSEPCSTLPDKLETQEFELNDHNIEVTTLRTKTQSKKTSNCPCVCQLL